MIARARSRAHEGSMRVERCRFGEVTIGGKRYVDDVIVFEDRVQPRWRRSEGHLLQLEDLDEVMAVKPEVLLVGTGAQGCLKIAPEVVAATRAEGIELLEFDTRTACQTFNQLHGKRRIVAVLHLTC
jgi:hypothetical protein